MIPAVSTGAGPAAGVVSGPAVSPAGPSFREVLESVSSASGPPGAGRSPELPARPCASGPSPSSPVRLLEAVDRARARLDGVLAAARSGRTFAAQELLGLQAEAYRAVQTVELGAKLVEQGAQAVRQALSAQV